MQAILKLDVAGQPRGWLSLQEAISAYARGDVIYGIGIPSPQCLVARSDSLVCDQSLPFNLSLRSMAGYLITLLHRYVTGRFLGVMIIDVFTAGISFREVSSLATTWCRLREVVRISGRTLSLPASDVTGLRIA